MPETSRIWLLLIGTFITNLALADCNAIARRAESADLQTLEVLYQDTLHSPDCGEDFRAYLGRRVARGYLKQARGELERDPQADVFATLQKSLPYARLWQSLAMLGDAYFDRRDFETATRHYQEALDIIADPDKTPKAPALSYIEKIFNKAERSRLLAETYVPTSDNERGEPAGLAATDIRGFVPERVAIPVTFVFDSTAFDARGAAAAADMLDYLREQGSQAITLIGHTDPQGSDAYNMDLSLRRAEAVQQYLKERGYQGSIRAGGRGKREPPMLDDPLAYTREERYRLHRRVELQRR